MKIDRLVSIIVILLRKERVQAKDLAQMFDVSVRTILRDIDTIGLSGIPIVTYQGTNGGIGIAEGYRLDRSILTQDEMASIIRTLKSLTKSVPDVGNDILIEKLKNVLSESQLDSIDSKVNELIIDISPWGENKIIKQNVSIIKQSIDKHRKLQFAYIDYTGERTIRIVEPYSLVFKAQKWYLYAWCKLRNDFRFFKLVRMREISMLDDIYEIRPGTAIEYPWENGWEMKERMVNIVLVFEKTVENVIEEWFYDNIERQDDGKLRVSMEMPENNWLYGFILSFGPAVEVLEPQHIRKIVSETAYQIYKKYI